MWCASLATPLGEGNNTNFSYDWRMDRRTKFRNMFLLSLDKLKKIGEIRRIENGVNKWALQWRRNTILK